MDHLWIILTEPSGDPPKVVIVNLTSYRSGVDTTVILDSSDHSFINHATVVFYADAREVEISLIRGWVALDRSRVHDENCSNELFGKVMNGLFESPFTPRKIKKICKDKYE